MLEETPLRSRPADRLTPDLVTIHESRVTSAQIASSRRGMMDRARAAHLISGGLAGDEADQAEDFSHGDFGPNFSEANSRHGGGSQDLVGGRRGPRGDALSPGARAEKRNP